MQRPARRSDSRVPILKAALDRTIAHYGRPELLAMFNRLEATMDKATGIKPNLDFPSGSAQHLIGARHGNVLSLLGCQHITGLDGAHIINTGRIGFPHSALNAYNGVE
ncbi:citrate/2-methylcitrate synthase [Paenarthrobacter nitroguajacolicus]|uniref:citrate/2-methylcitrate synthase n=1 Tax=Paenarthrobacter nitroguajacolicus TaxID=211146 RepID=UPI0015C079B7